MRKSTTAIKLEHADNTTLFLILPRKFIDKSSSKAMDADELLLLLPRLQEIVRHGEDGKEREKEKEWFAAFVQARRVAGSPVLVVKGPQNRLTLV
jgi:hypothetical protein